MPDMEGELTVNEIWEKYGYVPPKMWDGRRLPKYEANTDCFGYFPARTERDLPKCTALNKLYCRYEKCRFYKKYKLEGLKNEHEDEGKERL